MLRKSRFLTALFAFMAPGGGHIYISKPINGLSVAAAMCAIYVALGLSGFMSEFWGVVTFFVAIVIMYLYSIVDSVISVWKRPEVAEQWYSQWYVCLLFIVCFSLLFSELISRRSSLFGYHTYKVTAGSMSPTLQPGDFISVNTEYTEPKLGDVVAFLYPENRSVTYVKRIAAIGPSRVSIVNGEVVVDGSNISRLSVPDSVRQRDYSVQMQEVFVPENTIFMLGDLRDNSRDSRFWGPVPKEDVLGKVRYVWYSASFNRVGLEVD